MKTNNLWNRFFYKETLQKEKEKYLKFKKILGLYLEFYERIVNAKELNELLELHKKLWKAGFKNQNLGPCEYGIFRTKDIETMKPEEVFLGNVYGLWTNNIPFWEAHKDATYGVNGFGIAFDTKTYDLIVNQYREILKLNINTIKFEGEDYILQYEEVNEPIDPFSTII